MLNSLLLAVTTFSQEAGANSRINAGDITLVRYYNGIFFEPLNEASNKSDTVLCSTYNETFYLNGIQLDKDEFVSLRLSSEYLSNDSTNVFNRGGSKQGYGTYEYSYKKGGGCAFQIVYRAEVKLPMFLNGVKLTRDEQEAILDKITLAEILSIERKRSLFGGGEIYIKTKSHD